MCVIAPLSQPTVLPSARRRYTGQRLMRCDACKQNSRRAKFVRGRDVGLDVANPSRMRRVDPSASRHQEPAKNAQTQESCTRLKWPLPRPAAKVAGFCRRLNNPPTMQNSQHAQEGHNSTVSNSRCPQCDSSLTSPWQQPEQVEESGGQCDNLGTHQYVVTTLRT